MSSPAWLFAGLALALAGAPPRHDPTANPRPGRPEGRRAPSRRSLQWLAAAPVAGACLLALGPVAGAMAAAVTAPAFAALVGWLHRRPAAEHADPRLALCLDLVAVALRAGQPLPAALVLAAPAGGAHGDRLVRVAGLLRLGAAPEQAWAALTDHPVLGPVAAAGRRSAESGIRLAGAFEQRAAEIRAQLGAAAQARAHRIEVLVAAPLGLCFLPAFVCLGIVPTVIGVAAGVLSR